MINVTIPICWEIDQNYKSSIYSLIVNMSEINETSESITFAEEHPHMCMQYQMLISGADNALLEISKLPADSLRTSQMIRYYLELSKTELNTLVKDRESGVHAKYSDVEDLINYEESLARIVKSFNQKAEELQIDLTPKTLSTQHALRKKIEIVKTKYLLEKEKSSAGPEETDSSQKDKQT